MFLNGATNSGFLSRAPAPSLPRARIGARVRLQRVLVLSRSRRRSGAKIDGVPQAGGTGGCLEHLYPVLEAVLLT